MRSWNAKPQITIYFYQELVWWEYLNYSKFCVFVENEEFEFEKIHFYDLISRVRGVMKFGWNLYPSFVSEIQLISPTNCFQAYVCTVIFICGCRISSVKIGSPNNYESFCIKNRCPRLYNKIKLKIVYYIITWKSLILLPLYYGLLLFYHKSFVMVFQIKYVYIKERNG